MNYESDASLMKKKQKKLQYWIEKRNSKIYIFRAKYWNWITAFQIMSLASSSFFASQIHVHFARFSKNPFSRWTWIEENSFDVFTVFSPDKIFRVSDFEKKEKKKNQLKQ